MDVVDPNREASAEIKASGAGGLETVRSNLSLGGSTCLFEAHSVNPMEQVLSSRDVLPIILSSLKELLDAHHWRDEISSLVRVNRSFFDSGANQLWNSMSSILPALKLLPWFRAGGRDYRGLGTHRYTYETDWKRFQLYARRIRQFEFSSVERQLETHWIFELLSLPHRPSILFPCLNSVTFAGVAHVDLPLLNILASPSVISLEVSELPELRNLLHYGSEWEFWMYGAHHEEDIEGSIQAAFAIISFTCRNIQKLVYRGPIDGSILRHISNIKSITTLQLTWANISEALDLMCLRDMPLLCDVNLVALPSFLAPSTGVENIPRRSPGGERGSPSIRKIKVVGAAPEQALIRAYLCPSPSLEDLCLELTRDDNILAAQRAMALYILKNPHLNRIRVRVLPPLEQQDVWTLEEEDLPPAGLSEDDVWCVARSAFGSSANLQTAVFEGIPPSIAACLSSALQDSISGWHCLTSLTFRAQPSPCHDALIPEQQGVSAIAFPGLGFLATTVWLECPKLELLEWEFDGKKVAEEDLEQLAVNVKGSGPAHLHAGVHPLREFIVNVGGGRHTSLTLSQERKVGIVIFLHQLFPQLTTLRGTPSAVWDEVMMWLWTYRKLKNMAAA